MELEKKQLYKKYVTLNDSVYSIISISRFKQTAQILELSQNLKNYDENLNTDDWLSNYDSEASDITLIQEHKTFLYGKFLGFTNHPILKFIKKFDEENNTKYFNFIKYFSDDVQLENLHFFKGTSYKQLAILSSSNAVDNKGSNISIYFDVEKKPISKKDDKKSSRNIIEIDGKLYNLVQIMYDGRINIYNDQYEKIIDLLKKPHSSSNISTYFEIKKTTRYFEDIPGEKLKTLTLNFSCINHLTEATIEKNYKYEDAFFNFSVAKETIFQKLLDLRFQIDAVERNLNQRFNTVDGRNPLNYIKEIAEDLGKQKKNLSSLKFYIFLLITLNILFIGYLYFN